MNSMKPDTTKLSAYGSYCSNFLAATLFRFLFPAPIYSFTSIANRSLDSSSPYSVIRAYSTGCFRQDWMVHVPPGPCFDGAFAPFANLQGARIFNPSASHFDPVVHYHFVIFFSPSVPRIVLTLPCPTERCSAEMNSPGMGSYPLE